MIRTIRARYSGGALRPLEALDLEEDEEVLVSIDDRHPSPQAIESCKEAAGSWAGSFDVEQLKRDIYASRQVHSRPAPKL